MTALRHHSAPLRSRAGGGHATEIRVDIGSTADEGPAARSNVPGSTAQPRDLHTPVLERSRWHDDRRRGVLPGVRLDRREPDEPPDRPLDTAFAAARV